MQNSYAEDSWDQTKEQHQQHPQEHDSFAYRLLSSSGTFFGDQEYRIDYSVLSVGVLTLGLLMIVEVIRHRLDHAAKHRPFYRAVLEGVYTELATLGIVEVCLHIMAEYYEDYNKVKKAVFADVHFLLFYTAIFNAFQSCLLAAVSTRISRTMWIATEALELNHYIEILEEFENVKYDLQILKQGRRSNKRMNINITQKERNRGTDSENRPTERSHNDDTFNSRIQERSHTHDDFDAFLAGNEFEFYRGFVDVGQRMVDWIRYPKLLTRYNALLVQVRFHELRISFVKSYNMPLKLKISDYLVRCELQVLIRLIHVSSVAWLLLTGAMNLLYFILGVVSYYMEDPELVGTVLIWIFFSSTMLFIFLAWYTYNRMKVIFRTMMNDKDLWDVGDNVSNDERARLQKKQMSMFWGGDSTLVISAIQFMQFGYAISLSTVIIFWEEISDGTVHMASFVVVLLVCYAGFLALIGQVIPWFTVCTSLAQMVNTKLLQEMLAAYHLEEAKRKQKDHLELLSCKNEIDEHLHLKKNNINWKDEDALSTSSHNQQQDPAFLGGVARNDPSVNVKEKNYCTPVDLGYISAKESRTHDGGLKTVDKSKSVRSDSEPLSNELPPMINNSVNNQDVYAESFFPIGFFGKNGDFESGGQLPHDVPMEDLEGHRTPTPPDACIDPMQICNESLYNESDRAPGLDRRNSLKSFTSNIQRISVKERLRHYFSSKRYVVFSNIFGTMVAFFMVAKRVETFLHSETIVSKNFVTFGFPQTLTFWILTCWLVFFLCGDSLILYTILPLTSPPTNKEKKVVIAALVDIIMNAACVIVFMVAESKRCCYSDDNQSQRFFAKADIPYEEELTGVDNDDICSCSTFGSRTYGGLGILEPYVSIVGLRVFRHYAAKRLLVHFWNGNQSRKDKSEEISPHATFVSPFLVVENKGHRDHSNHEEHEEELVGTAAQLWQAAIVKHPEIVSQYGEFSGELLRAMLGIPLMKTIPEGLNNYTAEPSSLASDRNFKAMMTSEANEVAAEEREGHNKYNSNRSTDLQQIIPELTSVRSNNDDIISLELGKEIVSQVDKPPPAASLLHADFLSQFASPNARLVRSMRRCERKLLPIINKWTVVDVVMTQYEMVYFDVDVVAVDDDEPARIISQQVETMKQALIVTEGGKHMRLCDVAQGRRVVGHLQFSDIQSVHVDRYLPGSYSSRKLGSSDLGEIETTEFWINSSTDATVPPHSSRFSHDWDTIQQDILRIQTNHGRTICLRFFSDLEEGMLRHSVHIRDEDAVDGDNKSLQWAQSIGRFCGPYQLHRQKLPHLGDNTCNELRDYLVVHHRNKLETSSVFGRNRRVQSAGKGRLLIQPFQDTNNHTNDVVVAKPSTLNRRMVTFDERLASSESNLIRPKRISKQRARSISASSHATSSKSLSFFRRQSSSGREDTTQNSTTLSTGDIIQQQQQQQQQMVASAPLSILSDYPKSSSALDDGSIQDPHGGNHDDETTINVKIVKSVSFRGGIHSQSK